VDLKSEMSKVVLEKEEIEEKYRAVREQLNAKKLEIQRLIGNDDHNTQGKKLNHLGHPASGLQGERR